MGIFPIFLSFPGFPVPRSRQTILVTSHILGSDTVAAGGIYCSPRTGSAIMGGRCRSFSTIQADFFGSPLGLPTKLELVLEAPELWEHSGPPTSFDPYFKRVVALQGLRKGTEVTIYGERQEVREISGETVVLPWL